MYRRQSVLDFTSTLEVSLSLLASRWRNGCRKDYIPLSVEFWSFCPEFLAKPWSLRCLIRCLKEPQTGWATRRTGKLCLKLVVGPVSVLDVGLVENPAA